MIINFLKEEIDNQQLNKEYNKNYSDIPENDFMAMVKMDPNSYPKNGNQFDTTAEPIKVGNIAGGNGLLIRCYRLGEKDFLQNPQKVTDCINKYILNRSKYNIKNAAQFKSVADFINYVESDGQIDLGGNVEQVKKQQTPREKLEVLRQKQYPQIETVDELIEVADLDEDSDTEVGQIGNLAKTLLLPHYAAGERDFMTKKVSVKKALRKYYNADKKQQKEKPISKYSEKENGVFKYTVVDFIKEWLKSENKLNNNLFQLLEKYAKGLYTIVCRTENYDVIQYTNREVGWVLDWCDLSVEEYPNYGSKKDPRNYNNSTNLWCTGWPSSYAESYASTGPLIAFICSTREAPYKANNSLNFQINIYDTPKSGSYGTLICNENVRDYGGYGWHDIENGTNNHEPVQSNWPAFSNMLRKNPEILPYLMNIRVVSKNRDLQLLCQELGIDGQKASYEETGPIGFNWTWTDEVEVEPEPFVYTSPEDVIKYNTENPRKQANVSITNLKIAEGVTEIPDLQFQHWTALEKVEFPESLIKIGNKAFNGCKELTKIKLPPNLREIGLGAFEGCINLGGSIRLPLSISIIHQNAFNEHSKNRSISFVISPKKLDVEKYGKLSIPEEDLDFWNKPGRIKFSDN